MKYKMQEQTHAAYLWSDGYYRTNPEPVSEKAVKDLEAELTQLRTEREKLLEYLGRIRPLAKSIALISEADQDAKDMADSIWTISIEALTAREETHRFIVPAPSHMSPTISSPDPQGGPR